MKRCKICGERLSPKSQEQNCLPCKGWAQRVFKALQFKLLCSKIFPIAEEC